MGRWLFLLFLAAPASAQPADGWAWGWSESDTTWAEDALLQYD